MAIRRVIDLIATSSITAAMLAGSIGLGKLDGSSGTLNVSSGNLSVGGVAVDPTNNLTFFIVRAASTANIANPGSAAPQTVDGVSLAQNNNVLLKNQSTASQNGPHNVDTLGTSNDGAWTRCAERNAAAELVKGSVIYVTEGTVNGGKMFHQTSNVTTLDTDSVTYEEFDEGLTPGGTRGTEAFTGDASTVNFDLQAASPVYIGVVVDGIKQDLTTHYTYSATGGAGGVARVTFTTAPAASAVIDIVTLYRI